MTLTTRLHAWHIDHGARMIPFAGYEMPVFYPTGAIQEHHLVRQSAGLFDIDHMGQVEVRGDEAEAYLNRLLTWDVSQMAVWEAHYALMCAEDGGVIDDVFVYRLPDHWLVVINAANREKDVAWMEQVARDFDVNVGDVSDATYMIALQGPRAIELLQHVTDADVTGMARFSALRGNVAGVDALVGRTGYTGEDGVELFLADEAAVAMWEALLAAGEQHGIVVAPIGLAARDSLRFEPGFALYGHEIDAETTPLEAKLSWVCSFDSDFIGRDALLAQKENGVRKTLVSFELIERGVPREGYPVVVEGEEVGQVVTGMFAPTAEKYCGNAFVTPEYAKVGTPLEVIIRGKSKVAKVVKRPFYKPSYRN